MWSASVLALAALLATQANALDLPAAAKAMAERASDHESHLLPVSAFRDGSMETIRVEGALQQTAWQVPAPGVSTLDLLAPLRAQLVSDGFAILFECADEACGGFDFRFASDVLPEPAMHVDLGDFRFLAAKRSTGSRSEYVSLLVSRSSGTGFVQMTRVGPRPDAALMLTGTTKAPVAQSLPAPAALSGLVERLQDEGRAKLADLRFETGSAELSTGDFTSLADLAAFLNAEPSRRVILVGHTDAEGSLENNIALSRQRAAAVAKRLIAVHGVSPEQIASEGVGFLAPLTSNASPEGRMQNRRVEVVLASGG